MKFFIGIVPPLVTKERIFEFQKSFPSNNLPVFNEPHISVKASNGLTEDKTWLAKVIVMVGNQERFQISLENLAMFGDRVLFLEPDFSKELIDFHLKLLSLFNLSPEEEEKSFEGSFYHPHLTLGEAKLGSMTSRELIEMEKQAELELFNLPSFQVDFVRVYQWNENEPSIKLIDIPLKL